MSNQKNQSELSEGTALILLKECSSSAEFKTNLDSLGIQRITAHVKMRKALAENLSKFYPQKQQLPPLLTLRRHS